MSFSVHLVQTNWKVWGERDASPQVFQMENHGRQKPTRAAAGSAVAKDALRGSLQMEHFLAITGKQHRAGWVLIPVAKTFISHYHKQKHKQSPTSTRMKS